MEILIAIIAGIFALIGAWFGAKAQGRVQHKVWLQEKRSEAFGNFLENIEDAIEKTIDVIKEKDGSNNINIKIYEIYRRTFLSAKIVRMYLEKKDRAKFEYLLVHIRELQCSVEFGDTRYQKMNKKLEEIQNIFERNIEEVRTDSKMWLWFEELILDIAEKWKNIFTVFFKKK